MSHLSDIEEQMNTMKKTMEEIGEKIVLEKEKSIQNFLQALVQCGEISEEKKKSIENNVSLSGFFMKDLDELSMMDDVEPFEGRYTFPDEKSQETNEFIIRYIKKKYPECGVENHGHAPYCHEEKGDKEIYKTGCDVKVILAGLKMRKKTTYRFSSAGETHSYWDNDGFGCISYSGEDCITHNMVLRGEKFEELDKVMKIFYI